MDEKPNDEMVSSIIKAMEEDSKKFGSTLVAAAGKTHDEERTRALVSQVRELMKHRMNLYSALEKTKREIALYDCRLKAIEAGEFILDSFNGTITYKDRILNLGVNEQ
jgi:hypothetical protein